jgi:hypothetical protein
MNRCLLACNPTFIKLMRTAVAEAYHLPDFAIFLHEHSLDTVVINGRILADDAQRVAGQTDRLPD